VGGISVGYLGMEGEGVMRIRLATIADVIVTGAIVLCLRDALYHDRRIVTSAVSTYLRTRMAHGVKVYVAVSGESQVLLGTASLIVPAADTHLGPRLAYVEDVAVVPEFRRQGVGRRLVEHCVAEAGKLGVEEVTLFCNHDAKLVTWYRSLGFDYSGQAMLTKRLGVPREATK
jgi:ribosomal protein S18 acetylase RimI-like enzyme